MLLIAVLAFGASTGLAHSPADTAKVTTVSHAVAMAHLVARPSLPDQHASLVPALALIVGAGFVLVRTRRVVPHHPVRGRRPTGRAPPGPVRHH